MSSEKRNEKRGGKIKRQKKANELASKKLIEKRPISANFEPRINCDPEFGEVFRCYGTRVKEKQMEFKSSHSL